MKNTGSDFLKKVWRLTRAYWFSEEKWAARGLLAVIVALNLGHVYVLVLLNQWNNTFYNTMQNHDKEGFFSALGDFCILATFYILIAVYELYLQQMLQNKWRRWITADYLKNWLKGRTYYLLELTDSRTDNPDQRLSEDLRLFVTLTIQLTLGLLKATVTLVSFMAILWVLSGSIQIAGFTIYGYMVWIAILYAVVGTYLTAKIGHPLIGLNFQQQRYEADFRFGLVRLRENSEGVAFYNGEPQEKAILVRRFRNVFNNFKELMKRQKKLTWFTSGYEQIAIIFPLVVAAPRYFSNQMQLGGLIQTASAFGRVQDALSFFVASYSQLAEWRAVVNRLTGFVDHMEQVQEIRGAAVVQVQRDPAPNVEVKDLELALPNGQKLLHDLEISVAPGETLLITGPSGCGKSTLLRTLAGIWPFGRGKVLLPQGQTVLFLPQKPYLPLGSLRDVLLYPGGNEVGDSVIKAIMNDCKLTEFTDRLDQTANWAQLLSLGEQQRVAFARVLLQTPQWLFLDEATSALDEPTERQLYELLAQKLQTTTIVSVGHRQTLTEFHQKRLIFGADGTWRIQPIE